MRWSNMTFSKALFPTCGNSAFTHYPWVSLVCLRNIFQCVSVQSCRNILHVILKKSDTGKAGSCDMVLPEVLLCLDAVSVLHQTDASAVMESQWQLYKPRRGKIFDQLLSNNLSAQCFSILRESEVELNQTRLWGSSEGLLVPDGLPPPKELHCTRNPVAQMTGSNIFHFSEPSGMHLQGLPRQKPIPWIDAKQDGSKLC